MAEYTKLGDLGEIFIGLTYKPENVSTEGTIVLRSSNIQDGELDFNDIVRVNCPVRENLLVKQNDILMCSRNGSAKLVGKCTLLPRMSEPMTFGAFMTIIRTPYNGYLRYFFDSSAFRNQIKGSATTTINQITRKMLDDVQVPIFDIETQNQISAQFEKLSMLITLRKEQLAKLDQLVKSRFIELFGDYRVNNKGFECKKGNELFKFSSGKFLPEEKRLESGIPVYGGNGIAWYTDEPLIDFPTVIIGRVGAQCGNIHAVTTPVWISDNAIYIKEQKTEAYTLEFLIELMRMMNFYQYADFSGQPKITQKPLETLEYIIPPIELQKKYAAFVEQVDKQKLTIQQSLDKLEVMKKALMQEYFG